MKDAQLNSIREETHLTKKKALNEAGNAQK
jgi:hypothetical protein